MNKHFPADFGSTRLMERVVQQIFRKVESNEKRTKVQQMEQDPPAPTVDPLQCEAGACVSFLFSSLSVAVCACVIKVACVCYL